MKALSLIGFVASASYSVIAGPKEVVGEPLLTCPQGFVLEGKTCSLYTQKMPQIVCANGGTLQGADCVTQIPKQAVCADGTTAGPQGCLTQAYTLPQRYCPAEFHDLGGSCLKYDIKGIIEKCEKGTLVNGECEVIETSLPSENKLCPVGYQEEKGSCVKTEIIECTPPVLGKDDKLTLRGLAGKGGHAKFRPQGFGGAGAMPLGLKPMAPYAGFAPAAVAAPAQAPQMTAGGMALPIGTLSANGPTVGNVATKQTGPKALANIPTIAVAPTAAAAPAEIPHLSNPESKVSITQKMCAAKLEAPFVSTHGCPEGYTEDGKTGVCTSKTYYPTKVECSLGANHLCFPTTSAPYLEKCPKGTTKTGNNQCVHNEPMQPTMVCPDLYRDTGAACEAVSAAQTICEPGLALNNGICTGVETAEPLVQVSIQCTGKNCYNH